MKRQASVLLLWCGMALGCQYLGGSPQPGGSPGGTPQPSSTPVSGPCVVSRLIEAPIICLTHPKVASAAEIIPVVAWLVVDVGTYPVRDEPVVSLFQATPSLQTREVFFGGKLTRFDRGNPDCAIPGVVIYPAVASISLGIQLPVGSHTLTILPQNFADSAIIPESFVASRSATSSIAIL